MLQDLASISHSNARSLILDKNVLHVSILHDRRITLRAVVSQQFARIKVQARSLREGTGVVGEEVDKWVVGVQLLLPGLGGEGVVDGDDVDALDALGGELVGVLDVAGDLRGAGWGEGARDADDDVGAREGGEVDGAFVGVVFLEVARRGDLVALGERLGLALELVDESTGVVSAGVCGSDGLISGLTT